jgi:hypothetical protein
MGGELPDYVSCDDSGGPCMTRGSHCGVACRLAEAEDEYILVFDVLYVFESGRVDNLTTRRRKSLGAWYGWNIGCVENASSDDEVVESVSGDYIVCSDLAMINTGASIEKGSTYLERPAIFVRGGVDHFRPCSQPPLLVKGVGPQIVL